MSTTFGRAPMQLLAIITAALLAITGMGLVLASPAGATEAQPNRIGGENRYETARLLAEAAFPGGATDVFLASGQNFPDALAAAGLAGALDGPVLLTPRGSLDRHARAALQALNPDDVHLLGGTNALSQDVENAVRNAGDWDVHRFAGTNRFDTAALMAEAVDAEDVGDFDGLRTAIVATGRNFPDALAGGPIAFAGVHPILLVEQNSVPQRTSEALENLGIEQVIILGGPNAVSPTVEAQLGAETQNPPVRLAGSTRDDTAVEIGEVAYDEYFDGTEVAIARRDIYPDALAGGPWGGVTGAPIVLVASAQVATAGVQAQQVDDDGVPLATAAFLEDHAETIETVTALGGRAAVAQNTLDAAVDYASTEDEEPPPPTQDSFTEAPELIAASAVSLSGGTLVVDYLFDMPVETTTAPELFKLYTAGATATPESGTAAAIVETDTVRVDFTGVTTQQAAAFTVATVEYNAVEDADEVPNPEGDVAFGVHDGTTNAPDLEFVGDFETVTAIPIPVPIGEELHVTFGFNQPVEDCGDAELFRLYLEDGTQFEGEDIEDCAPDGAEDTVVVVFDIDADTAVLGTVAHQAVFGAENDADPNPEGAEPVIPPAENG